MRLIIKEDAIVSGPDSAHNGPGFPDCQKIKVTKLSPKVLLEYLHKPIHHLPRSEDNNHDFRVQGISASESND